MLFLRRSRISARSGRFMRIAAGLNPASDVARLTARSQEVLEAIVVRFQIVEGHPPVLNGHIRIEETLAIALACTSRELKIIGLKTVGLAVPMHHGTTESGARQE